jgi:hypothetical protein
MNAIRRPLLVAALFTAICAAGARAETTTLYYPTQDKAMFSIDAPADWEVTAIQDVGDFGSLESENGSVLQFRAIECASEAEAEKEIDAILESTADFLEENYTDINLDEPKEITIGGLPGTQLTGTGKDKEGTPVQFLSAMIILGPTTISEVWAAAYSEDVSSAQAVLESFQPAGSGD